MKYVLIVALMILGPVSYTHAKAAPGQAHRASTTKVVTGEDALRVANQLVRTGLVADGVDTPAGLGSRVYGTYKDKSATCDFPWQQREAVRCSIDSSLAVDESQYVTGEFAKKVGAEMVPTGLVGDGVQTPQGLASRVYGQFMNKTAACDYVWGAKEHVPTQCLIDASISLKFENK